MKAAPLEIRGLVKTFDGVVAVDGVDLTLGSDELFALVGPSGCGKSTLLRTVAGLMRADSGTIHLDGRLVDDGSAVLPPERRVVGLVFQEHALFPHLTVRGNIAFGLRDLSTRDEEARVDEMLELVSLNKAFADRYPHELSGGERQRVALARALAPEPALMLFDEPFASLDQNLRVQLRHDVASALKATKTPAVFVTHDQREALAIGDRIAVMREGRLVQVDTPEGVFHRPADTFVAAFMGEASFLPIRETSDGHCTALGPVTVQDPGSSMAAMVRPDDVLFEQAAVGQAEITSVEYHGSGWLASASLGDDTDVLVAMSHLDEPRVGERGSLALREGHIQVVVPRYDA